MSAIDIDAVFSGDRRMLARAITLVESTRPEDEAASEELLHSILAKPRPSLRIGISGSPGAGKSTFIEAFGMKCIEAGHRVAVLAVDPSSSITGGSILGDKTRMSRLTAHQDAFIRPSPSGGSLGGVNKRTREVMWLVEAAGFDRILVETVGVGQSEVDAANMTDFYLLIQLPNAGDELQGIKKGILELADCIFVNKSDIDPALAEKARSELYSALHFQRPRTTGWQIPVISGSAATGKGLDELLKIIKDFEDHQAKSDWAAFRARRSGQLKEWMHDRIRDRLIASFYAHPVVAANLPGLEEAVASGRLTAREAMQKLFDEYRLPASH